MCIRHSVLLNLIFGLSLILRQKARTCTDARTEKDVLSPAAILVRE